MAINITNREADALTRKLAELEGVGLTEAIVIAMKEAIARRRNAETALETASRLRKKHGIALQAKARKPLPRSAFDEMWGKR
jgi:antitoxin VapB